MFIVPYSPKTEEEKSQITRAGAVQGSYSDLAEIFARNYLKSQGFFTNSDLNQISSNQTQAPLLTYPFLDYMLTSDLSERNLLELGSGNSTLLFSKLFKSVTSYETNENWFNELASRVSDNVELNLIALEKIENADFDIESIDCLLIDFAGKRTKFINSYLSKAEELAKIIFLDNSDMYRKGANLLSEFGYVEVPFYGLKSGQTWVSCTSLFLSSTDSAAKITKKISNSFTKNNFINSWDASE
jgi:hypothetical protein